MTKRKPEKPRARRTSHEVRGLKYPELTVNGATISSHLTRGAWIEIEVINNEGNLQMSHLTRGAWIEIDNQSHSLLNTYCRTSHEVRGLK